MDALKISKTVAGISCSLLLFACGGGGGGGGGGSAPSTGGGGSGGGGGSNTVTLSGQVSGMSAGQLGISNSGADGKNINSDGSFSFSIPSGGNFDIVVEANPLEQLCSVTNGSGSNVNSGISDIQISCQAISAATSCTGLTDSDDDGLTDCQELSQYKTNPWLNDTDGDSFSDGREVTDFDPNNNRFIFNPRVADMATIAVQLTAVPEIDLDFSQGISNSRSVGTAYEQSEANSISNSWGGETTRQLEVGHTLSVEATRTVGTELTVSPTDIGASASYETSLSVGFETSTTQTRGSTVNWSNSATSENTRAYSETVDLTEQQSFTYDGGFLRITARVLNDGHIPYDLENLTLSAVLFDPLRPFDIESIGTMEFSNGGFPLTTILPGESAPLNFSTNLTLGKAQTLLRDSNNIVIMPGTYRLLDIDNQSILLVDRDVSARTATVVIDYGVDAARQDKFRVAINQGDGVRSISVREALEDVLGLTISEGVGNWIFGNDLTASTSNNGLLSLGNYAMSSDTNRYWLLAHNHNEDGRSGNRVTDYYNLLIDAYDIDAINLRAGDKLSLVYVGDADRDGLSDRMERELGTTVTTWDTDSDTLGDGLEVYGWLTNLQAPPCNQGAALTRVYSNPFLADSDGDTFDDAVERAACGNPSFSFVAEAGNQQFVHGGDLVTLNGSVAGIASAPPVYRWSLISGPDVLDEFGNATRQLDGRQPVFEAPDEVTTLVWEMSATIAGEVQTDTTQIQVQLNRMEAVYVGVAAANVPADGTQQAPYGSLNEALANIQTGDDLYVMSRTGGYTLVNTLNLPAGTSVFGGYNQDWVRDVETNKTTLSFATTLEQPAVQVTSLPEPTWFSGFAVFADGRSGNAGNDVIAVQVIADPNTSSPLYLTNNVLEASDVAPGSHASPGSSYGLMINSLATLRLQNNTVIAGRGGIGAPGSDGSPVDNGNDASGRSGASGNGGHNGGTGGDWGRGPLGGGGNGSTGLPTTAGGIRIGGAGGAGAGACTNATDDGNNGDAGAGGSNGSGATQPNYASFLLTYETATGNNGTNGSPGEGGGGGGGGGGCGLAGGGTGGGGGEGGEGGLLGSGGTSGGASIAIWLNAVANVELRSNTVRASNGGYAGRGGYASNGGLGGDGANGGAAGTVCYPFCDRGGAGADGGNGGPGGRGGDGGGGAGGASFGIFVAPNVSPLLFNNIVSSGAAGGGGFSRYFGGRGGDSYAIFDADLTDGATPVMNNDTLTAGSAGTGGSGTGGANGSSGSANTSNF